MSGIIGPVSPVTTGISPLRAHISHLLHLSKPATSKRILCERFGFNTTDANGVCKLLSSHIERALEFYESSNSVSYGIKPVLQYYAFLNLAVATILAYRPPNHLNYRSHGAKDLTASLRRVDLTKKVVAVSRGAINTFHRLFSSRALPSGGLTLRQLLYAIPMLTVELQDAFKMDISSLEVLPTFLEVDRNGSKRMHSQIQFNIRWKNAGKHSKSRFPRRAVETVMPELTGAYGYLHGNSGMAIYRSVRHWDSSEIKHGYRVHSRNCFKFINYGGHDVSETETMYRWSYSPRSPMIPTMTAAMLTSFVLSSLFRYRPMRVMEIEQSRLNILVDVFINEADAFMIPTFRNLLYREEMIVSERELG